MGNHYNLHVIKKKFGVEEKTSDIDADFQLETEHETSLAVN